MRAKRSRISSTWWCRTSSSPRPLSTLTSSCRHPPGRKKTAPSPTPTGSCTNPTVQGQMARRALPLPGQAKPDWWITQEIARRIGLDWNYQHPSEVYAEMASLMPALDNISWDRVERESAVTYPSAAPDQPGQDVVFGDRFPTQDGRGKLVPAKITPPDEPPDAE